MTVYIAAFLMLIFVGLTAVINPYLGLFGGIVFLIAAVALRTVYLKQAAQAETYIEALTCRIKKAGEEAFQEMPVGVVLYDEAYQIEWFNRFMAELTAERPNLISKPLSELSDQLIPMIKEESDRDIVEIDGHLYRVMIKPDERLLYFFDITEIIETKAKYENEKNGVRHPLP